MELKVTHELKCRFCGKVTGGISLPFDVDYSTLSIEDVRCDLHRDIFGEYKEMEAEYRQMVDSNDKKCKDFLKKVEYKLPLFDAEMKNIKGTNYVKINLYK